MSWSQRSYLVLSCCPVFQNSWDSSTRHVPSMFDRNYGVPYWFHDVWLLAELCIGKLFCSPRWSLLAHNFTLRSHEALHFVSPLKRYFTTKGHYITIDGDVSTFVPQYVRRSRHFSSLLHPTKSSLLILICHVRWGNLKMELFWHSFFLTNQV